MSASHPRNLEGLRASVRELMPTLRRRWPIASLSVFGSWARGEATPESDIDLLVTFSAPVTIFDYLSLEEALSAHLGAPVDLVTDGALKPHIGARIRSELVAI